MSTLMNDKPADEEIEAKLHAIADRFDREMRARGFEPAQVDNVALPSALAELYAELEELREELEQRKRDNARQ